LTFTKHSNIDTVRIEALEVYTVYRKIFYDL